MAIEKPVGILALQGDFSLHQSVLRKLGKASTLIKKPTELQKINYLIIPGGESTALLNLCQAFGFIDAIKDFAAAGGKIFGTCAGAILLAKTVAHPKQTCINLISVEITRNSYGRQIDSFEANGTGLPPLPAKIPMVFIRAPKITKIGEDVTILATQHNDPVLVRSRNILIATFHPELSNQTEIYSYWLEH